MNNINNKYNFNDNEKISIDCWYDIVELFRNVQWEHTDNSIKHNKQYIINCLVDFMCELDNFKEQFEKTSYTNYLDDLKSALVKLMHDVEKVIRQNDAPIFFNKVYELFQKVERIEK
ncbi:hypothetical protein QI229_13300 [Staphylococcus saprophyticus]|nr:hypothetical protein [Staphylococcus saprophyticus]